MLYTHLATIAALATTSLPLSTTFAFGAIGQRVYPKINRLSRRNDRGLMGSSQSLSAQSLSEQPGGGGDGVAVIDITNTVQLSSTKSDNEVENVLTQHHDPSTSYKFPSHPVKPFAHYVFLVHGYMGNDSEMSYLSGAFRRVVLGGDEGVNVNKENNDSSCEECIPEIIVHSVKCNVGKTHDGIRNGGTRLANEIIHFIREDIRKRAGDGDRDGKSTPYNQDVTYSLVGNSLGGLYARYAVSLLPHQLRSQSPDIMLNLHPNVFCTTATPHLGTSQHTYLPIPRIAETIIGTGMGTTGRDLFRLNNEKDFASAATGNIVNAAVGGVQRLRALRRVKSEGNMIGASKWAEESTDSESLIRNMCLQEKYLMPLRIFRQRIAYANAYKTDFQVPTETAAFLNDKSGVGHFVIASRQISSVSDAEEGSADGSEEPFIVAVVQTKKTSQPQSSTEDELVQMSQSLDALGWTKVFIDVRDRIPVRGMAKPGWLRPRRGSLDDLIRERAGLQLQSLQSLPVANTDSPTTKKGVGALKSSPEGAGECILTSHELAKSTASSGDNINLPLGHTVMIANSKNEKYSQFNSQGRPVMDKLASDMVNNVLEFE